MLDDNIDYSDFENLKQYLIDNRNGKVASGGSQVIIRCPYCGDSKDPRNAHMYIGPNRKRNMTICYYCFLCDTGGMITPKFFRDIECYDISLIQEVVANNNKKASKRQFSIRHDGFLDRVTYNPVILSDDFSSEAFDKLDYINKRIGTNFNFADISRLKIILNLNRYLKDNHIGYTTRYPAIMRELSKKCLGFLSVDNSHIIMRAIVDPKTLSPTIQRRYNNYAIFTTPRLYMYYMIPGAVDPTKPVTIHIAEGPFDILSVYANLVKDKTNSIFAAAAGKSRYRELLNYIFLQIGIPPYLSNIQLYLDSDMDIEELHNLKRDMTKLKVPVFIHRNEMEGEKDFGVPPNRIIDTVLKL